LANMWPEGQLLNHEVLPLILTVASLHWADPKTWPWVVWVWLAMLLVWCAKPLWRWLQRQQAQGWPTVTGRIESVKVEKKKPFLFSTSPRGGRLLYMAELAYSYTTEGHYHSGYYQREFASEEEGREFVRDLKGMATIVSYNPRNAAKSLLSEGAVTDLLNTRPPRPEGEFQVRVSEVPKWVKPVLWPFILLAAVGLGLSIWVHVGALAGRRVMPEAFFGMLHVGTFVVWIPTVLVSIKRVGNTGRKDFWKLVLRGSPEWMRYMVYGFGGYAMVNFAIFFFQAPQGGFGTNPPAVEWRGFSGHWMLFYSAALAILYSATGTSEDES
jgi:hypothetical protein